MIDLTKKSFGQLVEMRANTRWAKRQLEQLPHWKRTPEQSAEIERLERLHAALWREIQHRSSQLPLF